MSRDINKAFTATERTILKRLPKRASYERRIIYKILDEAFVCHIGFIDADRPVVIPTTYGRRGDMLYLHGSAASRMLRALKSGISICVTVTLLDGLVLARSAFHHSMNYRSVVVFGTASAVKNQRQKVNALRAISEHIMPGRWADVRAPTKIELQQTLVVRLPLKEASAKVRGGPPVDEEADYGLPVWAGEVPLALMVQKPLADPRLRAGIALPHYLSSAKSPVFGLKRANPPR
jgi:nitroimidazol reductase NimA-like FMN-containing flavoprotein (pyridoxamine 5'-phosphate oxidase superfamily)